MESITSRSNPLCAHLRKLAASASHRRESGEFLCDSPKLLEEVLLWRRKLLKTVLCTDPGKLPELPEGTRVVAVPESLMEYLSPARTPQGVLSLCRKPEEALPETLPGRRYALLDGVQDPGNVGTILRTADALFCDGLLLVGGCADPWQPKAVRASMGAVLRCPVWSCTAEEAKGLLSASPSTGRRCGRTLWTPGISPRERWPSPSAARDGASRRRCWLSATPRCASPWRSTVSR